MFWAVTPDPTDTVLKMKASALCEYTAGLYADHPSRARVVRVAESEMAFDVITPVPGSDDHTFRVWPETIPALVAENGVTSGGGQLVAVLFSEVDGIDIGEAATSVFDGREFFSTPGLQEINATEPGYIRALEALLRHADNLRGPGSAEALSATLPPVLHSLPLPRRATHKIAAQVLESANARTRLAATESCPPWETPEEDAAVADVVEVEE